MVVLRPDLCTLFFDSNCFGTTQLLALQETRDAVITRGVSYFEHLERTDSTGMIS